MKTRQTQDFDEVVRDNHRLVKKVEFQEAKLTMQEEVIGKLQEKLDDMWERQNLEKENLLIQTNMQSEQDAIRQVQFLTNQLIGQEQEIKHYIRVRDALLGQNEALKAKAEKAQVSSETLKQTFEAQLLILNSQVG